MSDKLVLGIETSCDDTSISILKGDPTDLSKRAEILAVESFSQETMLSEWGGVVPEIASRNHLEKIAPLLSKLLKQANVKLSEIDLIGVTCFPGLLGPLLTGLNAAKTISLIHKTPILPVNHLFAHLEAIHLSEDISYPYLGLLVSGGHSLFCIVKSPTNMEVIGTTIDDAAGEAFDKGGKLLGLGYPAGRIIDDKAKLGDPKSYEFPIGLRKSGDANLSYSGVKTSLRTFIENNPNFMDDIDNICASYQHSIIMALELKLRYAKKVAGNLPLVVGGGVACNSYLRKVISDKNKETSFVLPKYCTDNGAMIANYAFRTYDQALQFPECLSLDARSRFINKKELAAK